MLPLAWISIPPGMKEKLLHRESWTWIRLSQLNPVNCQSFRQEPRKDETADMMELAKKYQAKMKKGQMRAGSILDSAANRTLPAVPGTKFS